MEILRYILFFYAFLGVLIAGGLLFDKGNKASFYLMLFALLFSIEEIDFLYVTSDLLLQYPQFYMVGFPACLLAGPLIFFHIKQFEKKTTLSATTYLLHAIPFLLYLMFTLYMLQYSGAQRITNASNHYQSTINLLNYGKVLHVLFYAVLIYRFITDKRKAWVLEQKIYLVLLVGIYVVTSVLLTCLTAFSNSYEHFILYFLSTSTLVLFVGYSFYFRPEWLNRFVLKYANSGLEHSDMQRIVHKTNQFFALPENIIDSTVDLDMFCKQIGEKKHHVSQTLSNELNTSFRNLLNQQRVEYAKTILLDPTKAGLKILAVAFDSGFTNKSTFNRAFRKFEGCTPNEFREKQVAPY